MTEEELNAIKLHTAGATVMHTSPFSKIESYRNQVEIDQNFRVEWIIPFYLQIGHHDEEWVSFMVKHYDNISDDVILKNLGDFNWRSRTTGAYFAALKNKIEFIDIIGTHLTELIWEKKNHLNQAIASEANQEASKLPITEIEEKAFLWLNAKIHALPPTLAKIINFFLKLTPIGSFIAYFDASWMKKIDAKETMIKMLEEKINTFMKNAVHQAFPFWLKLIIPVNMILLFAMFAWL